jgi:hypothetical protein
MPTKVEDTKKFQKKYVVRPGPVISQADGQKHFIPAAALMKLYGVRPIECVVERDDFMPQPGRTLIGLEHLVVLAPRSDGKYRKDDGSPNAV